MHEMLNTRKPLPPNSVPITRDQPNSQIDKLSKPLNRLHCIYSGLKIVHQRKMFKLIFIFVLAGSASLLRFGKRGFGPMDFMMGEHSLVPDVSELARLVTKNSLSSKALRQFISVSMSEYVIQVLKKRGHNLDVFQPEPVMYAKRNKLNPILAWYANQ